MSKNRLKDTRNSGRANKIYLTRLHLYSWYIFGIYRRHLFFKSICKKVSNILSVKCNMLECSEWKEVTKYLARQSKSDTNPLDNQKQG